MKLPTEAPAGIRVIFQVPLTGVVKLQKLLPVKTQSVKAALLPGSKKSSTTSPPAP